MADELIDIYDEGNKPLGVQKMKSGAHRKGLWHRASHIWIYNSTGQILLQLRAKGKEMYPDQWDMASAGHAKAGEEPIETALREMKEELDLSPNPDELEFVMIRDSFGIQKDLINREHEYVYLLLFDGDIKTLHAQEEEIQEIKFFDLNWLEEDMVAHSDRYVFHRGDYWEMMIQKIRHKLGAK